MRKVDAVRYEVGCDLGLVKLGPTAFLGILHYQVIGENFSEVLDVNWLYPNFTDNKNLDMDKTIRQLVSSVMLIEIKLEEISNRAAVLLPTNTRKKSPVRIHQKLGLHLLNFRK